MNFRSTGMLDCYTSNVRLNKALQVPMLKPLIVAYLKLNNLLDTFEHLSFSLLQLSRCCNCLIHWLEMCFDTICTANNDDLVLIPLKNYFSCIHNSSILIQLSKSVNFNLEAAILGLNVFNCLLEFQHVLKIISINRYQSHRKSKSFRKLCKLFSMEYTFDEDLYNGANRFDSLSREWLFSKVESEFMSNNCSENCFILEMCAGMDKLHCIFRYLNFNVLLFLRRWKVFIC